MFSPSIALYVITILTALTGFVREAVIASNFGAGQETDAFFFAYGLTQTLNDLIFGGSLLAAVIPLLRPLAVIDSDHSCDARASFTSTMTIIVIISGLFLAALMHFGIPAAIDLLAPEMNSTARNETIKFGRIIIWMLPINALLMLFTLILNAHDRYRVAASIYLGNNVVFVLCILFLTPLIGTKVLAIAALAGPMAFVPLLAWRLWRMNLLTWRKLDFSRRFFASVLKLSLPPLLSFGIGSSLGLLMTAHMILRGFAAAFGQGGISAAGYAFRLYEAPLSILINPVATLIFPAVAAFAATGRTEAFSTVCRKVLIWGLIIMFPAAVATYGGAEIIVDLMLKRGNFDASAMSFTVAALQGFAPAVLFEGVFIVFFRVFYALHRPVVPVAVAAVTLMVLYVILLIVGEESLFGLALALSSSFALAAILLLLKLRQIMGADILPGRYELSRWAIAASVAAVPALFVDYILGNGMWERLTSLTLFFAGYTVAVMTLLPEHRREAIIAIGNWVKNVQRN